MAAADLEDSKSTSGRTLCVSGSHTFVPISWMCKKQTSVSRSSTETEIIFLDAGLRLDGLPALYLWDLIVSVLGNTTQNHDGTEQPVVCRDASHTQSQQSRGIFNVSNNVGDMNQWPVSCTREWLEPEWPSFVFVQRQPLQLCQLF